MKNLIATIALAAALFSPTATSDNFFAPNSFEDFTYSISYNFFTVHNYSDGFIEDNEFVEWNEINKIIGIRVNVNENVGYFIGKGENSFFNATVIGGVELSSGGKSWEVGVDIGLATGYEKIISSGLLPVLNPFVRYNLQITNNLSASIKVGSMNVMAENAFFELTSKF